MTRESLLLGLLAAVLFPAGSATAQTASSARDVAPTGTLRVTFLGSNPTQGKVDPQTGAISGPVRELSDELGRRLGVPVAITPSNGVPAILESLKTNTVDLGFVAIDPTRAADVDFSQPYLLGWSSYLVPVASTLRSVEDVDRSSVRVAANAGDSPDLFLVRNLKNATLTHLKNMDEVIAALSSGDIAAYAANRQRLLQIVAADARFRVLGDNFFAVEQAIAVPKGHSAALAAVNRFLDDAKASGLVSAAIERAGLTGAVDPAPPRILAQVSVAAPAPVAGPAAGNNNSFANLNPLPPAPTGPAPRLANGIVDLSGLWRPADNALVYDISLGLPKGETLPLTPEALKIKAARLAKDDPEANCLPTGVPRLSPFPWRILQTPTHIFFLFEGNIHSYRQIFMDGRPHPPDPDPTWYGHSTGRWDKDTLIIDTVGFNDRSWFDFDGHSHTERLHTTERYTRPNLGTLTEEVTIDDPGAYTRPFTVSSAHRLLLNDELMEFVCQENEKDTRHLIGPATPP